MVTAQTLRLVKSVNRIGRRMTSLIKKLIENVIGRVVPGSRQSLLRLLQPRLAFVCLAQGRLGLDCYNDLSLFLQRQWRGQLQCPLFVNGFHRGGHGWKIAWCIQAGKNDSPPGRWIIRCSWLWAHKIACDLLSSCATRVNGLNYDHECHSHARH